MMSRKRSADDFFPRRDCGGCGKNFIITSFSLEEWRKGPDASVCNKCLAVVHVERTARCNKATAAEYYDEDLENPFAEGGFRWAAKGVYVEGNRKGQSCVCKWFKTGGVMESHYFDTDMATANEAIRLISEWNAKKFIDRTIRVNLPEVWTFDWSCTEKWAGQKVMQEPFIENYEKFNSNTGWNNEQFPWARAMQALSHFSYHASNRQSLLCDLQGGVYRDGVTLTDPAILSSGRQYGPTDLGKKGISTFFSRHVCNEFCRAGWLRPQDQNVYYKRRRGSTMEHLSSKVSRKNMSTGGKRCKVTLETVAETLEEDDEWKEGDD